MECRSTEKRQWIVRNYNVEPVAHIQLLKGQTKHSDAGAIIENDYYIFHAVGRASGKAVNENYLPWMIYGMSHIIF